MESLSKDDDSSGIYSDDDDEEAIQFIVEAHANFIEKMFKCFGNFYCKKWSKAQTTNNSDVNENVAQLLVSVHIPYKNHLLNSEVNLITQNLMS